MGDVPEHEPNRSIHAAVRRDLDRFRRPLDAFADGDRDRATVIRRPRYPGPG